MEFRKFWVSISLVGLIFISIIGFITQFETDNNQTAEGILGNSILNKSYQNLNNNLSKFGDTSQTQLESIQSESSTSSLETLIIFSIVSAGRILGGMIITVFTILIILPASIFGINQVVASVLSSIFLVTVIIGLWKLFKVGE